MPAQSRTRSALALIASERDLACLAVQLGAALHGGPLSAAEAALVASSAQPILAAADLAAVREAIIAGEDPLGERLCALRPTRVRRVAGAVYTPAAMTAAIVAAVDVPTPARFVDPGCGSGRFVTAILRRQPGATVIAIDLDPLATLLTRATLAACGWSAHVVQADYLSVTLPAVDGPTVFVGNPPYVRHHELSAATKQWARQAGAALGVSVSGLAGLHALFFLATALHARPGDRGCFITSAEWLSVGYGRLVRDLLAGPLGASSVDVASTAVFDDALTSAAITRFTVGERTPTVAIGTFSPRQRPLALGRGEQRPRHLLATAASWTASPVSGATLGSVARVHRGIATGANGFFVMTRAQAAQRGLTAWCRPIIHRASEVIAAGEVIRDSPERHVLLCVPPQTRRQDHPELDAYLAAGEGARAGHPSIAQRFISSHRTPWWSIPVPAAPPVVATYMGRTGVHFATNPDGLLATNVVHGLHPRTALEPARLLALVRGLNAARDSFKGRGRTYGGGLEKFEPGELERLPLPT